MHLLKFDTAQKNIILQSLVYIGIAITQNMSHSKTQPKLDVAQTTQAPKTV